MQPFRVLLSACLLVASACSAGSTTALPIANAGANAHHFRALPMGAKATNAFSVLYDFAYDIGYAPMGGFTAVNGVLYGATQWGGFSNGGEGTIFSLDPAKQQATFYPLTLSGPIEQPLFHLTRLNGTLYGTSWLGKGNARPGAAGGVAYSVTYTGTTTVVHGFGGTNDGVQPSSALTPVNGVFYGVTAYGGAGYPATRPGNGTIYSLATDGTETVLHTFAGGKTDGSIPYGAPAYYGGYLYGTTAAGGKFGRGTFFKTALDGTTQILHSFGASDDAGCPEGDLVQYNGQFYGVSECGGSNDVGTVFRVSTSGVVKVLHAFTGGSDGSYPFLGLLLHDGLFYGSAWSGGDDELYGTIFRISPSGAFTRLHSFSGSDGSHPVGELSAIGTTLYGVTTNGGGNGCPKLANCGVVFSLGI